VTEDTPARGEGLYPIAKVASEAVCRRYRLLYGMKAVSGRVCATYGPMERPTRSRQGMSAICELARAFLEGRPARVRGLDIARTWTHVYDIAGELVALLKAPQHSYDAYNISYGVAYTLEEVLGTFQKIEPGFRWEVAGPDEPADVAYGPQNQRGSLLIDRIRQDTGYEPRFDLESGLRDYLGWVRATTSDFPQSRK
jgi:nucleoside-diphosphate-sugar epimerase